jgi:hypothetical protein
MQERKTVNNTEMHLVYLGTRQNKTQWKPFNRPGQGEKGEEVQ